MSDRKFHFLDGCAIVVIGVLCLVISAYFFMPYIEANVGELRAGMAYHEVCDQQKILSGIIDGNNSDLNQDDPWGEPYIVETLPDGTPIAKLPDSSLLFVLLSAAAPLRERHVGWLGRSRGCSPE